MVARLTNLLSNINQTDPAKPLIAPSLLSADFTDLRSDLKRVASADLLHLDIMDGVFVPNISFGPLVVEAVAKVTDLPLDAHLMVQNPEIMIRELTALKVQAITISFEAGGHLHRHIMQIKNSGALAGIALNPGTSFESAVALLPFVDLVLVMSVNPGFGGQKFIATQLEKVKVLRQAIDRSGRQIDLEIDGGINAETAQLAVDAGADVLVAGTATFQGGPSAYASNIARVRAVRATV